jgi:uncharacterized protein
LRSNHQRHAREVERKIIINLLLAIFGDQLATAEPNEVIRRCFRGTDMHLTAIETSKATVLAPVIANLAMTRTMAKAANGDAEACFELGVAFSTGENGMSCDLVEAHKWFNLAAARGHEDAAHCRADVSEDMTAREIAEAQRRARELLAAGRRSAA